ncbi:MAG: STAS domain-containing protein [Pirellulales bacterium]
MDPTGASFELEQIGATVVASVTRDLGEFDFPRIEAEVNEALDKLDESRARNLLVDFHRSEYFGSSVLGLLLKLRKQMAGCQGRMVLCGISEHQRAVLRATRLDGMWPIFATRAEALEAISA